MKTRNKVILFCLLLTSFLSLNYVFVRDTDTLAYYSDVESSTGNILVAGVLNNSNSSVSSEADLFKVLNSVLVPPSGNQKQSYWKLDVKGTSNITIDKIQVWWNSSQVNNSHMTRIVIKKSEFFNGSKSSGELIDGTDYPFYSNNAVNIESYFDSDVSYLTPLTINITMGDGSVKNYVTG